MSKSRREALQAGFDAVEAGSDPVEAIEALGDVGADDAPQDDPAPARDAAPAPDGERIARPASGQVATPAADGDKFAEAPKNWKPEFREKYKTLPPDIKAYLYQREDEQAKGVEPILQKAKRADAIDQIFEPIREDLNRNNVPPELFMRDVISSVATLARGNMQQKVQTILGIAQSYGVHPDAIRQMLPAGQPGDAQQQPLPPVVQELMQQVSGLQTQVKGFYTQQEAAVQAEVAAEYQRFAADPKHPHFEVVRPTMARLIQAGMATDMEDAYTKAIRHHDDLWQQQQADNQKAAENARRTAAANAANAARRNAISPRSSTPVGSDAAAPQVKGRRAAIEAAFDQHVPGGRV